MPIEPEAMESLTPRFPASLVRVWNIDAGDVDGDNRPGLHREHVFDTASGLRFMVSRDQHHKLNDGKPYVHVSVSFRKESEVEQVLQSCGSQLDARETYLRFVRNTFAGISGIELPDQPIKISA